MILDKFLLLLFFFGFFGVKLYVIFCKFDTLYKYLIMSAEFACFVCAQFAVYTFSNISKFTIVTLLTFRIITIFVRDDIRFNKLLRIMGNVDQFMIILI